MFVGLTGGIGSGKSTAKVFFADMGWRAFDADEICHRHLDDAGGGVCRQIASMYGGAVLDPEGKISRSALGRIVLSDSSSRGWLNEMLHPLVLDEVKREKARAADEKGALAMFDVPLLFEVGWQEYFDMTVVVYAEEQVRFSRLMARGVSLERARGFMDAQMRLEDKVELADRVLVNNGGMELLRAQCLKLHEDITSRLK